MGKRGSLFVIAAIAVCASAPLASCLDATEIYIQLSTDVDCNTVDNDVNGTHVLIRIGSPANVADNPPTKIDSTICNSGDATASSMNDLGNVVVVPSGGFDTAVAITVALSDDTTIPTSACLPEAQGPSACIYAHRQISFLPHSRVTLPIVLSSACAGVTCVAPLTCDPSTRQCTDGHVDVNDCGTSCSTGKDSGKPDIGTTIDSPTLDISVFDAPQCAPNLTKCNGQCVDLQTSKLNCGFCGFDCGSAQCTNGSCLIEPTLVGTCLAVVGSSVYVGTDAGVFQVPTSGGTGTLVNNNTDTTLAMAGTSTDAAWMATSVQTLPYLYDLSAKQTYQQIASYAKGVQLMAFNKNGFAWFDEPTGTVNYLAATSTVPQNYAPLSTTNPVPVAIGGKNVYASAPLLNKIVFANGTIVNSVTISSPGAIVVDDPDAPTHVYDVEKSLAVWQRDTTLANPVKLAAGTAQITSMAWDGQTIVTNTAGEIAIAQNGMFVQITPATPQPKCIAVDANAVYWNDKTKGVYRHYKP